MIIEGRLDFLAVLRQTAGSELMANQAVDFVEKHTVAGHVKFPDVNPNFQALEQTSYSDLKSNAIPQFLLTPNKISPIFEADGERGGNMLICPFDPRLKQHLIRDGESLTGYDLVEDAILFSSETLNPDTLGLAGIHSAGCAMLAKQKPISNNTKLVREIREELRSHPKYLDMVRELIETNLDALAILTPIVDRMFSGIFIPICNTFGDNTDQCARFLQENLEKFSRSETSQEKNARFRILSGLVQLRTHGKENILKWQLSQFQ